MKLDLILLSSFAPESRNITRNMKKYSLEWIGLGDSVSVCERERERMGETKSNQKKGLFCLR